MSTRTPADPAPSETRREVEAWIGIDPGISGAIAVVRREGSIFPPWIVPTPTWKNGKRREFDHKAMAEMLAAFPPAFVAIERVNAAPMRGRRQGTSSMFNFGNGYGVWLGILAAQGTPYVEVWPRAWKARLGLKVFGTGKDASVRYAKTIDPGVDLRPTPRSRVDSHGFADAYCLALYARSEWRTMRAVLASSGSFPPARARR